MALRCCRVLDLRVLHDPTSVSFQANRPIGDEGSDLEGAPWAGFETEPFDDGGSDATPREDFDMPNATLGAPLPHDVPPT